jgi:hypothetical protein
MLMACSAVPESWFPAQPLEQGMQCDLDSPTDATSFQYTGKKIIRPRQACNSSFTRSCTPAIGVTLQPSVSHCTGHSHLCCSALGAGYGIIHEGIPLVPEGPGGVLIKKASVDAGVWLKPAPANLTAAGVYSLQVSTTANSQATLAWQPAYVLPAA